MSNFPFEIGQIYNREQIANILSTTDANIRNGVFRPRGAGFVLLFVTEEHEDPRAPSYHDQLRGNVLTWYGQLKGRTDRLIINSSTDNLKLLLFHRKKKRQYSGYGFQYLGPVSYVRHKGSRPTLFTLKVDEIVYDTEESSTVGSFREGNPRERSSNFFERDPDARAEAIRIHGFACSVCGFDFESFYGHWGTGYAEVHHVLPLSRSRSERETNPETDLVVLCSNCHRMIHHFRNHILTPDELKEIVDRSRGTSPE